MTRIGVQLHTFRDIPWDLPDVVRRAAEQGFDGVEFAHELHEADTDAVAAALSDTGMEAVAGHVRLDDLTGDRDDLLAQYETLDCTRLVVPHLPPGRFLSVDRIDTLAHRLTDLSASLDERGFELAVHNTKAMHYPIIGRSGLVHLVDSALSPDVGWELLTELLADVVTDKGGYETGFDRLVAGTESAGVPIELDVGHAGNVGCELEPLVTSLGERLFAIHLSDGRLLRRVPRAYQSTSLGEGEIDIGGAVQCALDHEVDWVIGEVDDPPNPELAFERIGETMR